MSERWFEPDPLVAARVTFDRVVLVPLDRSDRVEDNLWVLEGPAVKAWVLLSAGLTLDKVRDRLRDAYDIPAATVEADLAALVEGLLEAKILRERT